MQQAILANCQSAKLQIQRIRRSIGCGLRGIGVLRATNYLQL